MAILFTNINSLVGTHNPVMPLRGLNLAKLPFIEDAYLIVEGDEIADFGKMNKLKKKPKEFAFHFNAKNRYILPAWCDSHTHLVFSETREKEFIQKIKGVSYSEIAASGGGILHSAKKLNDMSEDELFSISYKRLQHVMKCGTGAIEIKSGYGLSVKGELKMLRVIKRLRKKVNIPVKATFLGAHAVPEKYKNDKEKYIELIIDEMLPAIAREELADYIDVFCERGFFTPEETERICIAGRQYGLKPKIHANQLSLSGGVEAGIKLNAISVDHLEMMDEEVIKKLAASQTIATLLPTAAFFLRMPMQPARELIDQGCAIALATDYNPGSSPSGNMNFVISLSCIQMRMLPEEAINAATINGAFAMEVQNEAGSIAIGKKANLIITEPVSSLAVLPYSFGDHLIHKVMLCGEWL